MADNNGQERDELHRAIWSIADDLRGSVDGWDFKSYVLVEYLTYVLKYPISVSNSIRFNPSDVSHSIGTALDDFNIVDRNTPAK